MAPKTHQAIESHQEFINAVQNESKKFQEFYLWLEEAMPESFFNEVDFEKIKLIAHNLINFHQQEFYTNIHLKDSAIVICLDSPDADLRILKNYNFHGIKNYRTFVSLESPPIDGIKVSLRIATLYFTAFEEEKNFSFPKKEKDRLKKLIKKRNPKLSNQEFDRIFPHMTKQFLSSFPLESVAMAIDMFFRAQTRDFCQYEVNYNKNWKKDDKPSMEIMLAWKNTPKHNFLYRLMLTIQRHNLSMKWVNSTYIDTYDQKSVLVMAITLHGSKGQAAWEAADIVDFLRELVNVKYFASFDSISRTFVDTGLIRGNLGNLLRAFINLIHQILVHADRNLYTIENVAEGLYRHPEITLKLLEAFEIKFNPDTLFNEKKFDKARGDFLNLVEKLDTGNELHDTRRKNVLIQALNVVDHTLKTNFYRNNKSAFSFRLDPRYLDNVPYDRSQLFPELPFAIFFVKGMHFIGFQVRFRDLSRGGLRTIFADKVERMQVERDNVFKECYSLAYTQHKKNKDIPEGGSKAVIFLKPFEQLDSETAILQKELVSTNHRHEDIDKKLGEFRHAQTEEYLFQTQRAWVSSLLTLINCEEDGKLRAKHVVDYWKKPEYIYLGPDENMQNHMLEWIADLSKRYNYKPGGSFVSSKPSLGINHKEFGVTSLGVHTCMNEVLRFMDINPKKDNFSVKMTGGPDGDVAGNQIKNLHRHYKKTAKLLSLIDKSGTIFDPKGLDLDEMMRLFKNGLPLNEYPPKLLSDGGYLLDCCVKEKKTSYETLTLCWRKKKNKLVKDWVSGNEMNHLLKHNVHQTISDIFIPAGGRPRTLNAGNIEDFLDENGDPTSRAIVEGANLYLTEDAREILEDMDVIIIKDSSANKGGVICSSYEVLCGLTLSEKDFTKNKKVLVKEILKILENKAKLEAKLLLETHEETGAPLSMLSDEISAKINLFTDQIYAHLKDKKLSQKSSDPLTKCFLAHCPPTLSKSHRAKLFKNLHETHIKAIIASYLAAMLVYKKGLNWSPSITDILPLLLKDII
jgi:glutamate dehydrogenase